jgi:glycosyltransferase involved in cell wall biosynthesis
MSQPPWNLLKPSPELRPPTGRRRTSIGKVTSFPSIAESADTAVNDEDENYPIVVLSHLGWDWVWQRPQQYLSRFAQTHPVLFVETYCSETPATRVDLRRVEDHPNITVAQMHLPCSRWTDSEYIDRERRRALQTVLCGALQATFKNPLLWFYDPMAVVAFAGHLHERAIIYDCMDELAQFKGAPPMLVEREQKLLAVADVVFCGGQKMRKKRLPSNPNCHFFGTGVDVKHFGQVLSDHLAVAPEISALGAQAVLGYFGVIDERIDYDLLAKLADARSDWHVVMVGPTAKVNPADFPRRPNLHFIGGRPYPELPALTKGFSVALMPFALNAATEYINPTKALEYMAAGRPVVSTALDEVKMNFGTVARIAHDHDAFVEWCLREAKAASVTRIKRGLKLARENTWEANIARMKTHIAAVLVDSPANVKSADARSVKVPRLAYV